MIPHFRIHKIDYRRYVIKRKIWLLYPLYHMKVMTKNEFFGDLTSYGEYVMGEREATFNTLDEAYDALHVHAMIKGYPEVILKVGEKY